MYVRSATMRARSVPPAQRAEALLASGYTRVDDTAGLLHAVQWLDFE